MNTLYSRILSSWPAVKQAAAVLGAQAFMAPSVGTLPKGQTGTVGIAGVDTGKSIAQQALTKPPRHTNDTTLGTSTTPKTAAQNPPRTVTPRLQIPRKTVPNAQRPLSGVRTPRV